MGAIIEQLKGLMIGKRSLCFRILLVFILSWSLQAQAQTLISISNPPATATITTAGGSQFWPTAGTVDGVPISLRATVTSLSAGDTVNLFTSGDNPVVRANTGTLAATVVWEVFDAATGAPIEADPNFLITDIDGNNGNPIESVSAACAGLTSFTTNGNFLEGCNANNNNQCASNIRVTESSGTILGEGTQNQNGGQQEGFLQYSWNSVTSWTVNYFATTRGRWFVHDADGDIPFDANPTLVNLVDMATIKGVASTSLTAPAIGEQITFEIEMSNLGPAPATGGNLIDTLPVGLNLISASATSGTVVETQGVNDTIAWSNVDVAVGGVEILTIVAEVVAPAAAGDTLTNETTTALANESICSSRDALTFSFIVAETPDPSLEIIKSVSTATSFNQAGDSITYSYEVENTGNINIDNVVPTDTGPTFGGQPAVNSLVGFTPASVLLAPGAIQIFTATYVLDQADVDNMAADTDPLIAIENTASATGDPAGGVPLPTVGDSSVETGFQPTPSLTIEKAVSPATSFSAAGDTITYQYTVTNTGNITIDGVVPTDTGPTFNGVAGAASLSAFNPSSVSLAPGIDQVFTATYELAQSDVDNMAAAADPLTAIDNSASATGDPVGATPLPTVPNSEVETGFAPDPSMTIAKSVGGATSFSQAGDVITYEYLIENTGNVTISGVTPIDLGPTFNGVNGTNSLSVFSPSAATIEPSDPPVLFTATYVLSQDDIDNMFASPDPTTAIDNVATANGTPAGGILPAVVPSEAETGFALDAELTLSKSAGTPSIGFGANPSATDGGDTINYSFEVTNSGDVTINALSINDTGPSFNGVAGSGTLSAVTCPLMTLAPAQTTTCSAVYTLSQADVDNAIAGGVDAVENTASAVGEDPNAVAVISLDDTANQTIALDSAIEIVKSASAPTILNGPDPSIVDPGDSISYQLNVANTGNTTLTDVFVSDSIATVVCPATTALGAAFVNDGTDQLAVGDSIICSAEYLLLQSDLDAGGVENTADVSSQDPTGAQVTDRDTVNSGFTQRTSIALTKSATPLPDPANVGDPITYTFLLTNTGNVTLTSPEIDDPICQTPASPLTFASGFISGDAGVVGEMEAGETWQFECIYNIDLDDINAGEVENTATATGTPPADSGLPNPSNTASNLAEAAQDAAIALEKSSSLPTTTAGTLASATDLGDTVDYSFEVENTGNVTLTNVVVSDPLITGAPNNGTISCPPSINSIAPGDVVVCTATYTLTQIDIDAGLVPNTATATGTPPATLDAPEAESSNAVIIPPAPQLSVEKSVAALVTPLQVGDPVTYSFVVENAGNVTINGVSPVDSGPTFNGVAGTNSLSAFTPAAADLAPGESETFSATYLLSQTDIDNIAAALDPLTAIDNSASATGTPENGSLPPVTPSTAETGAAPDPQFELIKVSTPPTIVAPGQNITYNFTLANTGNVTISSPTVTDPLCTIPGTVLNFASGFESGDTGATPQALDVGEAWLFSCTYAITQDDINNGTVQNTATAGGQDPSGGLVEDDSDSNNPGDDTGADDDPTNTPLAQTSSWTVEKSTSSTPSFEGDTLVYQFEVENTGNVDISSIVVNDNKCAAAPVIVSGDVGNDLILSPPETFIFECTSIPVSQVEVDAGEVLNDVTVIGSAPPTAPALPAIGDDISTPIAPAAALTIDKSSAAPSLGFGDIATATDPGDTIVYSFEVTNTGNVTLSSLVISDPGPSFGGNAGTGIWSGLNCPLTSLLPQQSVTCMATYTLTQADIDAAIANGPNSVSNTAQADAQTPDAVPVSSPPDEELTSIESNPEVLILKDAGIPSVDQGIDITMTDPGDIVEFTITVENTGNTTLSNVLVSDSLTSVSCSNNAQPSNTPFVNDGASSLAVGDSVICTATYTIEQSDINSGQVINTASVSSTDPAGTPVDGIVEEISPFTQRTSIALTKTATELPADPPPVPGDLIIYSFELENTGNVSLSDPQINDPQCGPPNGNLPSGILTLTNGLDLTTDVNGDGVLDAGETWIFMCEYAITQADIINEEITNTATASGTPPASSGLDDPTSTSSALVKAAQNAAITLNKIAGIPTTADGSLPDATDVGDTVNYTFEVANTGNLPFDTVTIDDPLITDAPNNGTLVCQFDVAPQDPFVLGSTELAINQSITCEAEYTLTQADIDSAMVSNTATAIGDPPGDVPPPPEATSGAMVPIEAEPSLTIDKSALQAIPSNVVAGDTITYQYIIENTGNVSIDNIAPIDLGPTFNGIPGTNALSAYDPVLADLAPGESQVYTASYVFSQQDLDNMAAAGAGAVTAIDNEATADGEPTQGLLAAVDPSVVETGVVPEPSLALVKTSSITTPVFAGSLISYSFTLNNNGNVTITNPIVADDMCQFPAGPLSFNGGFISGDTGATPQALDVGETWVFQCDYAITQADIDAGTVQNTALASGQDPSGASVDDTSGSDADNDDPTDTLLPRVPTWSIDKSTDSAPTLVGDTLLYNFLVTNTGNTSITPVSVADEKCVGDFATLDPSSDIGSDGLLSPAGLNGVPAAEQWRYSCVSIAVTQAEIDSGEVINNVDASGTAPGGNPQDASDQLITPVAQAPSMSLVKSAGAATLNDDGSFDQVFNFELKNTGNVTLNNVAISDNIPAQFGACFVEVTSAGELLINDIGEPGGTSAAALAAAPTIAEALTLGVEDSLLVSNYIVRFNPNALGCLFPTPALNTASGSSTQANDVSDNGTDPDAANPNDAGSPTPFTPPLAQPQIGVSKAAGIPSLNQDGTFDVEYTLRIQNTGDVDLTNISLEDDLVTQFAGVFTASTASDLSSGIIVAPQVSLVTDSPGTVAVLPGANQLYDGSASPGLFTNQASVLGVGDIIEVSFTARIGPSLDGAALENTATAGGADPSNGIVLDDSDNGNDPATNAGGPGTPTSVLPPTQSPSLIISKEVASIPENLGDGSFRVIFNFVVENDGDVDISGLQIEDDLLAALNNPTANGAVVNSASVSFVSGTPLTPNPSFTGTSNVNMLTGSDLFPVGASSILTITMEFTPDEYLGPYNNSAVVSGSDPSGATEIDNSENASEPTSQPQGVDEFSDTFFTIAFPTVPISLGSFSAVAQGDTVLFNWVTQTEVANIGFNLYARVDGEWVFLNDELILSQGDSVSLQNYEFSVATDATVFSLSDLDVNGNETLHGPFSLGASHGAIGERRDIDWRAEQAEREAKQDRRKARREARQRQRIERKMREMKQTQREEAQLESDNAQNEETSMLNQLKRSMSDSLNGLLVASLAAMVPSAQAQQEPPVIVDWVNLATVEAGVHEVSYEELAASGADLAGLEAADISVVNQGIAVPLQVLGGASFGPGSSLRFIAQSIDTLYTDENIYTVRSGAAVNEIGSISPVLGNGAFANSYLASAKFAPQVNYSFTSPDDDDAWHALRIVSVNQAASETVTVGLDNVAVGGNTGVTKAKMSVNVWGGSDLPVNNDHRIQVSFNGQQLTDERFDGLNAKTLDMDLAQVFEGDNEVTLTLPTQAGIGVDVVNVNEVEVNYPRQFIAQDNRLSFTSQFSKFLIRGFSPNTVDGNGNPALDVVVLQQDPQTGAVVQVSSADSLCPSECFVRFAGSGQVANYYVSANEYRATPTAMVEAQDINSGLANYLIISHPDFIGADGNNQLEALAQQLTSEMGSADVVDVEQIYAQYSGHVFDPTAIQRYIQHAHANRGTNYVLLVGGDVYDYRNFENEDATSFIPSLYAATGNSVTYAPVDAKYVDVDDDNVVDLSIGRLPVRTTAQLTALLNKRASYLARDYAGTALIVADEYDEVQQYDFAGDASSVADQYLGNFQVTTAFADDLGSRGARQALTSEINQGTTLTAFFGHSSTNQWSFNGLFTGNDAAELNNVGRPTVVTQWGCWNAYYVSPNEDSMGHRFMTEGEQGAVAVMGATTLTNADAERRLAQLVFARLAAGERLGDAVTNAKQAYAQTNPNDLDVLLGWTILGMPDLFVN